MSFVLFDGRTGEVPRRTIGSRADTHGGRVSSGVTGGEAAARDRLVRRAGGPPAAVGSASVAGLTPPCGMSELAPAMARREDERKAGQGGESPEDQQDP